MKIMSGSQIKAHPGSLLCAEIHAKNDGFSYGSFNVRVFSNRHTIQEQDQRFITFSDPGELVEDHIPDPWGPGPHLEDFIRSGESLGSAKFCMGESHRSNFQNSDNFLVLERADIEAMQSLLASLVDQAPGQGEIRNEQISAEDLEVQTSVRTLRNLLVHAVNAIDDTEIEVFFRKARDSMKVLTRKEIDGVLAEMPRFLLPMDENSHIHRFALAVRRAIVINEAYAWEIAGLFAHGLTPYQIKSVTDPLVDLAKKFGVERYGEFHKYCIAHDKSLADFLDFFSANENERSLQDV